MTPTGAATDEPGRRARGMRRTLRIIIATLLIEAAALAGWWAYDAWRAGRIVLTNDGPPLTVEVLRESDDTPIGEPIPMIQRATLTLPAGDYRLRVSGEGSLSQVFRCAVVRGETFTQPLTLDDDRLLGEAPTLPRWMHQLYRDTPTPFTDGTVTVELTPGKSDLIELSKSCFRRRDGATGKLIWDAFEPVGPDKPARVYHPWFRWLAETSPQCISTGDGAPDVDGDGTRDLVVRAAGSAFLAVSGKDGSVLWTYQAELDGPGGASPQGPNTSRTDLRVGDPSTADLDGDGVPDVIATIAFQSTEEEARRAGFPPSSPAGSDPPNYYRRAVVAISGRSGRRLWSHPIDTRPNTLQPPDFQSPTAVVQGRRSTTVAFVDGSRWIGLDPSDGRRRIGPIDLGPRPVRPVQHADLDGDGEPEILALGPGPANTQTLVALSITSGRPLWLAPIPAPYANPIENRTAPDWPMMADLDGDGRAEIAVPDDSGAALKDGYRGVRLIDGASGLPRWTRPMRPRTRGEDGLIAMLEAPDLDRDGVRDLVATSLFLGRQPAGPMQGGPEEPERFYVDALSGKDGHPLWWWHLDGPRHQSVWVVSPMWWGRGPDGWPLLAVPAEFRPQRVVQDFVPPDAEPPTVHMLEASTGREVHALPGLQKVRAADINGDGLTDLWGSFFGELCAFRGEPPVAWRALGTFEPARDPTTMDSTEFRPAADLDGDGIADTFTPRLTAPGKAPGSRVAMARSGRDGRLLWATDVGLRRDWFEADRGEIYSLWSAPMPAGDLDGDGTPDVVVREEYGPPPAQAVRRPPTLPLALLSGRTGRPAWVAGALPVPFEAHGDSWVIWAEPQSVEPGAPPDLIVRHNSPFLQASPAPPPPRNPNTRPHLARVSGRTGRILWDLELGDRPTSDPYTVMPIPKFEDLDGDGRLDVLLVTSDRSPGGPTATFHLQAVSLRDGRRIWSRPFDYPSMSYPGVVIVDAGIPARPAVAVLSGSPGTADRKARVHTFDGRDGRPLWSWTGAEDPGLPSWLWIGSARFGAGGERRACVSYYPPGGRNDLVLLDAEGREARRRNWPHEHFVPRVFDLDGDGRDELIFWHAYRLRVHGPDLREAWSWPEGMASIVAIVPASPGRPSPIWLGSGVCVDGKTGRPDWLGLRQPDANGPGFPGGLLDPGDATRRPFLIVNQSETTFRYAAIPAAPDGRPAPPVGDPVPPGRADRDPRWTRPLPWTRPILHTTGLKGFLVLVGLGLANVALPLAILRLAARRRPWTIRLLMALPIAAAVPLSVFLTVEPLLPAQIGTTPASPRIVFALWTLAGVPIVALFAEAVGYLARRRWQAFAGLAALTLAASYFTPYSMIRLDRGAMSVYEHYDWSYWYLAVIPGAYNIGVVVALGWPIRAAYRLRRRPDPPASATGEQGSTA